MSQQKCSSWALAGTLDEKGCAKDAGLEASKDILDSASLKPTPINTRRCRHLEETMFPRYLNLDAKHLDDFCMGKVKPGLYGKNTARLYIESLHLKAFMKDRQTLMEERNVKRKDISVHPSSPKRPCLPLRKNSDNKSKSAEESKKHESSEGVTDKHELAQMYFGGFEGKRTCLLSDNSNGSAAGVPASYCQVIPTIFTQSVNPVNSMQNSGVLKSSPKEASKNTYSANEQFNHTLSSEKKLVTLRNRMKLHNRLDMLDDFIVKGQPDASIQEDCELKRLHGLMMPIAGYIPPNIDAGNGVKSVASPDRDSLNLDVSSPDSLMKQTPSHDSDNKSPVQNQQNVLEGKSGSKDLLKNSNSSTLDCEDAYKDILKEGQAQSMAANMLLESFKCNRRSYLSNKNFNCAWCTSLKVSRSESCTGDELIQCLECDLVGCGSSLSVDGSSGNQHMMLHFLLSGHKYGVSCGPLGELFCMGCGDFVHQECFDQERERLFIDQNYPSLSWKDQPIIRGVDASSFITIPEQGHVWQGLKATYPIRVPSHMILAARYAAKRLSIFRGHVGERSVDWGGKSLELSLYIKDHLSSNLIQTPVGFYNMGNTCYMSAVLHCLVNCKRLEKLFLLDLVHPYQSCEALCNGNVNRCLACQFDKIFLEYFGSSNGIDAIAALEEHKLGYLPLSSLRFTGKTNAIYTNKRQIERCGHPIILSSFLNESWRQVEMKQFAGQNQNDAQEFFSSFINALATSDCSYLNTIKKLKESSCPTQIKQPASFYKKEENVIGVSKVKDIFTGSLKSILTCKKCGRKRTQVESFNNISLPISKAEPDFPITIESCLDHFTKPDLLTDLVHCPSCGESTGSTQQHAFVALPPVICFHLKRFDATSNRKITDAVSFPERLDMGRYLHLYTRRQADSSLKQTEDTNPKALYELFGTVNHNGTLDKGHYTASILKEYESKKHWFTINDEFVANAGEENGAKEVLSNDNSYMLFYSRCG